MKTTFNKAICIALLCTTFAGGLYGCGKKEEATQSGPPADIQQFLTTLEGIPESQRPPYLRAYPDMTQKAMQSSDPQVQAKLRKLVPGAYGANR
jgi:hypothetical protein